MPTSARCSRQQFHEETPGQTEAVPEAGQPLIIGHFALQIVEAVEKIQPEGGADLVVAGADALQPLLIAGGLTESKCLLSSSCSKSCCRKSFIYQHPLIVWI